MDISVEFMLNGKKYLVQSELVNTIIVVTFLSLLGILIGYLAKKADFKKSPKGLLLVGELFVENIQNLVANTMGKANLGFTPYIGALTLFLATSNLLGLVGLKPPTSNYNVTLSLALISVTMTHVCNIKFNGIKSYIKGYFEPYGFLFPINLLGNLSTPLSMSFRIFGNILSGVIVTTLLVSGINHISMFLTPFIMPLFHAYFDVFSGLIQTFVFIMLTMINVSQGIGDRE